MKTLQEETLFAPPRPITRVDEVRSGYSHREPCQTELAAAVAIRPISGKVRRQVFEAIRSAGFHGITRREIEEVHGIRSPSVCSAVKALEEGGFIRETDRERGGGVVLLPTERGWRVA